MRILRTFLICLCLSVASARADHTQAQLLLADDTARPGDTVLAGVRLKMEPGWHTYWKNPGAAGMATKIEWQLPPGVTAGEIQWPLPEKLPPAEVTTYGYDDQVILIVPLKLAADLKAGPLDLKAKVSWLECKEECIPGGGAVEATLNIGSEAKPSSNAALISSWKEKTPTPNGPIPGLSYTNFAWWEKAAADDTRPVIIERRSLQAAAAPAPFEGVDFFPDAGDGFDIQPATEKISADSSDIKLRLSVKKYSGDWPKEISGVLVTSNAVERQGTTVRFSIGEKPPAGGMAAAPTPAAAVSLPGQSLWKMLLYAFVGGLILNIMPCVLPVIALKIVGFVKEAHNEPKHVRKLGFIYSAGVLASFLAMAAFVIGIQAAGHRAGWGMQFSNPYFLIVLTVLVTLVALNLFGIFEINLGSGALTAAGSLASRQGASGAFFNGVLATVLATPCTASILGTALGFAFAQGPVVIVAMFLVMGAGLAFPYLLLSCQPGWLKFLPKPGAWMEKFKIAMGFPMLATAIWLFSVTSIHYGERSWWLAIFLVFIAIAAWIYGEFIQRGRRHKGLAFVAMIAVLAAGYCWPLNSQLRWRHPVESDASGSLPGTGIEMGFEPWSPAAIAQARSENRPVLVDFTAKWCVTCNSVVAPALKKSSVQEKFKETHTRVFVADYSLTPPEISDELARYGRAGVPLVLVYPKDPSKPAIVLQEPGPFELPSHYASAVIAALDEAAK